MQLYDYEKFVELKEKNKLDKITSIYLDYAPEFTNEDFHEILKHGNITSLKLSKLPLIKEIPDSISNCTRLKNIEIVPSRGSFYWSPEIKDLENLEEISLSGSNIKLPNLEKWTKVKYLKLSFQNIQGVSELQKLKSLMSCKLRIPIQQEEFDKIVSLKNIQFIQLFTNTLDKVYFNNFPDLYSLVIESTSITTLEKITDCPSLEYLTIKGGKLQHLGSFNCLDKLRGLDIQANGANLPDSLLNTSATEITLTNFDAQEINFDTPKVNQLQLHSFSKLEKVNGLEKSTVLNSIELNTMANQQIDFITSIPNLSHCKLNNLYKLTHLPNFSPHSLHSLQVSKCLLIKNIDTVGFDKIKKIGKLILKGLKLTKVAEIKKANLEDLEISSCSQLDTFSTLMNLKPKKFTINSFPKLGRYDSGYAIFFFIQSLSRSPLSLETKKFFYDLYMPKLAEDKDINIPNYSREQLLQATHISLQTIREDIYKKISEIILNDLKENPLNKEIKVAIEGITNTKKIEFKQLLENAGIVYHSKIKEDTSHVVIGKKVKNYTSAQNLTWCTEQILITYVNEINKPYLLEENDEQNIESLRALLMAGDDSVNMGLEILSTGGIPSELYIDLFLLQKTTENQNIKKRAKKMLVAHGTEDFHKALSNLGRFTPTKSEYDLTSHIEWLQITARSIDWIEFSYLYFQKSGKGLNFFFNHASIEHPKRKEILKNWTKANTLDLNDLLFKELPEYTGTSSYHYRKRRPTPIPTEIFDMKLEALSLRGFGLKEIPKELLKMTSLKRLDLAYNHFTSLPKELLALENLEELSFGENQFKSFPMEITQFKKLKTFKIFANRDFDKYNKFKVKEIREIQKKMPNIEIIIKRS